IDEKLTSRLREHHRRLPYAFDPMHRKRARGFTLLELMVVVAIIAILAAIAIVNYRAALNRAKQKRTVADMRNIAVAWEARASELARYNAAGFTFPSESFSYGQLK